MTFSFFQSTKPLVGATRQLLSLLNINVTSDALEETIVSHPDYPSMLAISDALSQWKVENMALRVNSKSLDELSFPFITFVDNEFRLITNTDSKAVYYLDNNDKKQKFDKSFFGDIWGGVALLAEAKDTSGEKGYNQKKLNQNAQLLPFLALLAISIGAILMTISLTISSLMLCKLVGVLVSSLLLWYEIDKYNPALQKICGGNNQRTNCDAILNSSQSKIFSWLSWSEVGFFYFMGSFLVLTIRPEFTNIIVWLNVLALPYILFSIGYQAFVAKQWCPLCLTVQGLLFTELLIALAGGLFSYPHPLAISDLYSGAILVILSLFTLPVSVWYFVKPHLQNANEGKNHKFELSRLKNNAEIFYAMLEKQKEIDQNTTGLGVTIGKIDSPNTIIKVCNPHCNPCSEAHPEIEKLLDSNVKIQIIYNASNYDHDITRLPAKHFLAIANKNDPALLLKVLNDWYSDKNKNYEKFAVKYPVQNLEAQVAKIDEMHQWCNDNAVSFTPTYFFNGRQLPSLYKLADLKYFLGNN